MDIFLFTAGTSPFAPNCCKCSNLAVVESTDQRDRQSTGSWVRYRFDQGHQSSLAQWARQALSQ
jgi:hypothetical protein